MAARSSKISFYSPAGEVPQAKGEHILVIRLSAMGDVAMLVPVLRVVTATYPQLKITVLTRKFFTPIFNGLQNVAVYEADVTGFHSGIIGLSRLAMELRELDVNAVADVHNVLRSNILKAIFNLYGIPVRQIDKGRSEKKGLTAVNNKVFKQLKTTHQRYADVFSNLGYPIDLKKHQFPEKQKISENIRNIVGTDSKKWIGIAPFAQYQSKVYPLDLLEKVLEQLEKDPAIKIILFGGGEAEKEKLEQLSAKYKNVISIAGKLKFKEELALISNLAVMLSMDSGNGHLAAIYGIPVITVWGVTHPFTGFKPFGQPLENSLLPDLNKYPAIPTSIYGNKVPKGYEDVMRTIPPEKVVEKIKSILSPEVRL